MPAQTPTVTYSDIGDGTGVTATIAGSTALSTNKILTARWSAGILPLSLTQVASRVGDGTVLVPAVPGLWFSVVRSEVTATDVGLSAIGSFRATDGEDALHFQLCEAVQSIIQAMSLAGVNGAGVLDPTKVIVRKLPWRGYTEVGALGIIVTPIREIVESADNERDDVDFRVQVSFLEANDQKLTTGLDWGLLRRQQVIRAFSEHELPGISGNANYITYVDPGPIIVPDGVNAQYDVGGVLLHCHCYVTREAT